MPTIFNSFGKENGAYDLVRQAFREAVFQNGDLLITTDYGDKSPHPNSIRQNREGSERLIRANMYSAEQRTKGQTLEARQISDLFVQHGDASLHTEIWRIQSETWDRPRYEARDPKTLSEYAEALRVDMTNAGIRNLADMRLYSPPKPKEAVSKSGAIAVDEAKERLQTDIIYDMGIYETAPGQFQQATFAQEGGIHISEHRVGGKAAQMLGDILRIDVHLRQAEHVLNSGTITERDRAGVLEDVKRRLSELLAKHGDYRMTDFALPFENMGIAERMERFTQLKGGEYSVRDSAFIPKARKKYQEVAQAVSMDFVQNGEVDIDRVLDAMEVPDEGAVMDLIAPDPAALPSRRYVPLWSLLSGRVSDKLEAVNRGLKLSEDPQERELLQAAKKSPGNRHPESQHD